MSKKNKVLPKTRPEWEKLQKERADILARLDGQKGYLGEFDRQGLAIRLVEVKRALNRLYRAQQ